MTGCMGALLTPPPPRICGVEEVIQVILERRLEICDQPMDTAAPPVHQG
jgi:hypothetical protein